MPIPDHYPRPIFPDSRLLGPQPRLPRYFAGGPHPKSRRAAARSQPDYLPHLRQRWPRRTRAYRPEAVYDPARLDRFGLPHLQAPKDLAAALGITLGKLKWLTFPNEESRHYWHREVPKRPGGTRLLCVPKRDTRAAQDWILKSILARIPVNGCCHGFVPGRSIATNAAPHVGKPIVINLDLKDFFPSVSFATVDGLFEWMGYSQEVAWFLAMLCTSPYGRRYRRVLPQGAPTSPAISNIVCFKLDRRLLGLAARFNATYTRYADDLTLSGDAALSESLGRFLPILGRVCAEEGFRLNPAKTRFMRRAGRQQVTGLVVNDAVAFPRKRIRALRALLHNCQVHGVASQNQAGDPLFKERAAGQIAAIKMANPAQAARLQSAFDAIPWP